jgi:hypothetical protein
MFFICAHALAWSGWQMTFSRVSEAISTVVPLSELFAVLFYY